MSQLTGDDKANLVFLCYPRPEFAVPRVSSHA